MILHGILVRVFGEKIRAAHGIGLVSRFENTGLVGRPDLTCDFVDILALAVICIQRSLARSSQGALFPRAGDRERHARRLDVGKQPFSIRTEANSRPFLLAEVAPKPIFFTCESQVVRRQWEDTAVGCQPLQSLRN